MRASRLLVRRPTFRASTARYVQTGLGSRGGGVLARPRKTNKLLLST